MKQIQLFLCCLLLVASACSSGRAQEEPVLTTFILVRHAEKADDGSKDPPLTELGQERAEALAKLLQHTPVNAVFSSNYLRTKNTAQPLAEQNQLDIQLYEPHQEPPLLDRLKEEYKGKTILISGHSNTIPGVVNYLIGEQRLENLEESEYDKVFIVTLGGEGSASLLTLVLDLEAIQ